MNSKVKKWGFTLLTALLLSSLAAETPYRESGEASWYGPGFEGRQTASGEVFNSAELTAAHKTLPFGTLLRVTNRENGRSVVVRVNDRGPFVAGRIIDLSRAAAAELRMLDSGTVPVTIESLNQASQTVTAPAREGVHSIQVASFGKIANAEALLRRLRSTDIEAEISRAGDYYRVILRNVPAADLEERVAVLAELGFKDLIVR